jgi:molecular chaperone DnaJ
LGATIDVLTLDGMVELAVPAGTQPGAKLFLRGKGVRRVKSSGRGSQYVHLKVQVPRKLTPRQKELMEEFLAEEQTPAAAKAASSGGKPDATASFAKLCERTFAKLKGYLKPEEKKKDSKKDEKKESE